MPHIDDGTLHALLDGALKAGDPRAAEAARAHLEDCPDCRARLEAATELRLRAGEVLNAAAPDVVPDFAEVLVRAGVRTEPAAGAPAWAGRGSGSAGVRHPLARQARWTRGAAWAASLVLALGTGYLIGDRFGPMGIPTTERLSQAPPPSYETAPAPAADRTEDAPAPPSTRAPEPLPQERAVTDAAPPARPAPRDGTRAELAVTRQAVAETEAEEPPMVAAATPEVTLEDRPALALDAIVVTGLAAPRWTAVDEDSAATLLDGPLFVLADGEPVALEARTDPGGTVVRTRQRLADGTVIELTQRTLAPAERVEAGRMAPAAGAGVPIGAAAAAARPEAAAALRLRGELVAPDRLLHARPPAPEADGAADEPPVPIRTVRVVRDGYALVLSGPLPEEALRALVAGVRLR